MTFTKSWLQKQITDLEATRDEIPFGLDEDGNNTLAALKLALAGMEAVPVYNDFLPKNLDKALAVVGLAIPESREEFNFQQERWIQRLIDRVIRFADEFPPQPATVVPDDGRDQFEEWFKFHHGDEHSIVMLQRANGGANYIDPYVDLAWIAWKDSRAAMLQGAEPVTTAYNLPVNTPCKDAPEHIWLQTAGVWPENGEFSELTWCSDNQHQDDTLYVRADVVTGNSPVITEGWVTVPVEPTPEMREAFHIANEEAEDGLHGVWSPDHQWQAMLSAAPQQESE